MNEYEKNMAELNKIIELVIAHREAAADPTQTGEAWMANLVAASNAKVEFISRVTKEEEEEE